MVALCTGSQGEPRAALARIAADEHPEVTLSKGDRVIFSSRPIPGNEKAIGRIINQVIRFTSDPKNSIEPNAPPGTVTVFLGVGGSSIDLPRQPV